MRSLRLLVTTAAFGVALALAGCGAGTADDQSVEVAGDLSTEASALVAMGFAAADLTAAGMTEAAAPAPAATASPGTQRDPRAERRRHPVRVLLRRNTLHGEAVVQGKDGTTRTVVVQRGTVTAVDATSITVRSTDGFTLTWTYGDPLHVVEHRTAIKAIDVAVGVQVGVAGSKEGDKTVARLIVIPNRK